MHTEKTNDNRFVIRDLSRNDLELITEALVIMRSKILPDTERFSEVRKAAIKMDDSITVVRIKQMWISKGKCSATIVVECADRASHIIMARVKEAVFSYSLFSVLNFPYNPIKDC